VVRYLETFYRHRLLMLMPILLALVGSLVLVVVQPRMYQATANLWFDASPLADSSAANPYVAPADAQAAVLHELLQTRAFSLSVAHQGPLAEYLARNGGSPFSDPLSAVSGLLGKGANGTGATPQQRLDDLILQTINQRESVAPVGPHVLGVSFSAPDPVVAQGTVQAIVDEFFGQISATRRAQAQAAVDFYNQQLRSTAKPALTDRLALDQYSALLQKLNDAQLSLAAQDQAGASGYRLVDKAQIPDRPVSRLKLLLLGTMGGLVAGLVLSTISLMLLTWADRTVRRGADIESLMGRRAVSAIPRVRKGW
jgi:uncharacterized protein involved in exopolysaccharide biosynthesis